MGNLSPRDQRVKKGVKEGGTLIGWTHPLLRTVEGAVGYMCVQMCTCMKWCGCLCVKLSVCVCMFVCEWASVHFVAVMAESVSLVIGRCKKWGRVLIQPPSSPGKPRSVAFHKKETDATGSVCWGWGEWGCTTKHPAFPLNLKGLGLKGEETTIDHMSMDHCIYKMADMNDEA